MATSIGSFINRVTLRIGTAWDIDLLADIDRDAGELFAEAGVYLDLPTGHEFLVAERRRWLGSLRSGRVLLACVESGKGVGFVARGVRDHEPFVEQISVRRAAMRQGVGGLLLAASEHQARQYGESSLWLTTYAHLPWNRPYYERRGFALVSEQDCGPGLRHELQFERRWLPLPQERVVMRKQWRTPERMPTGVRMPESGF